MSSASDFVIENGVLKKYVGSGGDVVVPSTLGGYTVGYISQTVFQENTDLTI